MRFDVFPTTFSPAEVAQFTDVSTDLQRDWRRRGIIDNNDGFGVVSLREAVSIFLTKMLSTNGFGPMQAAIFTRSIVEQVLARTLNRLEVWDGEWDNVPIKSTDLRLTALLSQYIRCSSLNIKDYSIFLYDRTIKISNNISQELVSIQNHANGLSAHPIVILDHVGIADELLRRLGSRYLARFVFENSS
ncbi:MAG: hypothetical protein ABTQ34_05995 [Bdellovibrionales bacterium]